MTYDVQAQLTEALSTVVRDFGMLGMSDSVRVRAALNDVLGSEAAALHQEVDAVVQAVAIGIPTRIADEPDIPTSSHHAELVAAGVSPPIADLVVACFVTALEPFVRRTVNLPVPPVVVVPPTVLPPELSPLEPPEQASGAAEPPADAVERIEPAVVPVVAPLAATALPDDDDDENDNDNAIAVATASAAAGVLAATALPPSEAVPFADGPSVEPEPNRNRNRKGALVAGAVALLLVIGGTAYAVTGNDKTVTTATTTTSPSTSSSTGTTTPTASAAPTAKLAASCTNLRCTFDASGSKDDGTIKSYRWAFGDGSKAVTRDAKHPHRYTNAGKYTVKVVAVDNDGRQSKAAAKAIDLKAANRPPTASFTKSCSNLVCIFDASASTDDGTIAQFGWNFGDRSRPGSGQTTRHTYRTAGTYTVTLTVTDNNSAAASTSLVVTVSGGSTVPPSSGTTGTTGPQPTTITVSKPAAPGTLSRCFAYYTAGEYRSLRPSLAHSNYHFPAGWSWYYDSTTNNYWYKAPNSISYPTTITGSYYYTENGVRSSSSTVSITITDQGC